MFISTSLVAVCIYALTILTEFGFLSYFGVPSYFVEASIVTNTIYLRQIGEALLLTIRYHPFIILILLASIVIVYKIAILSFGSKYSKVIQIVFIVIFASRTIYYANTFGIKIATASTGFTMLSNCTEISSSTTEYIVPAMRGNSAIAVPIGEGNKLLSGFYLKDMSSVGCKLEWKEIGLIKK